jgi:hypothetical protein
METDMEYLFYLLMFGIGMLLGWKIRGAIFLYNLSENPQRVIDILEKIKEINEVGEEPAETPTGTLLRIEKHGPVLYAFASENDEFIAQGPNLNDLLESAHKRFPGRVFFGEIPSDDPAKELV